MRGHGLIQDAPSALRFVRMLTSPETWYLLWRDGGRVEVLDSRNLFEVLAPRFGQQGFVLQPPGKMQKLLRTLSTMDRMPYWLYDEKTGQYKWMRELPGLRFKTLKTESHPDLSQYGDGFMGILAHQVFIYGGFTPPQVQKVTGGFQITRWVFTDGGIDHKGGEWVMLIREFVGKDGEYKRTILKKQPPPRLPGISWVIMTFE